MDLSPPELLQCCFSLVQPTQAGCSLQVLAFAQVVATKAKRLLDPSLPEDASDPDVQVHCSPHEQPIEEAKWDLRESDPLDLMGEAHVSEAKPKIYAHIKRLPRGVLFDLAQPQLRALISRLFWLLYEYAYPYSP